MGFLEEGLWFYEHSMNEKSDLGVVGDRTGLLRSVGECEEVGSSMTNGTDRRHPSRVPFPPRQFEPSRRSFEELQLSPGH